MSGSRLLSRAAAGLPLFALMDVRAAEAWRVGPDARTASPDLVDAGRGHPAVLSTQGLSLRYVDKTSAESEPTITSMQTQTSGSWPCRFRHNRRLDGEYAFDWLKPRCQRVLSKISDRNDNIARHHGGVGLCNDLVCLAISGVDFGCRLDAADGLFHSDTDHGF